MYLDVRHRRQHSLKPFLEYRESEKHSEARAACSRAGELLEYETLALRVVPPNIEIENSDSESVTRVTVDSANRPGTLVEVRLSPVGLEPNKVSGCLDLPLMSHCSPRKPGPAAGGAALHRAGPGDAQCQDFLRWWLVCGHL